MASTMPLSGASRAARRRRASRDSGDAVSVMRSLLAGGCAKFPSMSYAIRRRSATVDEAGHFASPCAIGGNRMLKVFGRSSSFNVQKVMWLVDELALVHVHIPAGGGFGGLDAPEVLGLNPHGRVPVIEDDGVVVWESHTILRYLGARYSGGRFWSDDPAERSRVDGWMDWAQTALQPDFLIGVFWGFYRTPEPQRNLPAIRAS